MVIFGSFKDEMSFCFEHVKERLSESELKRKGQRNVTVIRVRG